MIKLILILITKIFSNFVFYERTYTTAIDGLIDNKIIGKGAKSFRYFCKEEKYVNKLPVIFEQISLENLLDFDEGFITDIYFKKDEIIKWGDPIFTYSNRTEEKTFFSKSNLFPDKFYFLRLKLPPLNEQNKLKPILFKEITLDLYFKKSGCTTHPHNFYIQLLSETGILGFVTIFSIFLYLIFLIFKNFYISFQKKHKKLLMTNFQISLILGFITTLLPFIPNGNFFNNWISMIIFYPIGFYLSTLVKNKR